MQFALIYMIFLYNLHSANSQVKIGEFYFPVTVQPLSYEVQKTDRMDTVYDEVVNVQQDTELKITNEQIKQHYENGKWKPLRTLSVSSKFKPSESTYKTDQLSSKEVNTEVTKPLTPSKAIQFKINSGIPLSPTYSSPMPFSAEPVITMSYAVVNDNSIPDVSPHTLAPLPLLSGTGDVTHKKNIYMEATTSTPKKLDMTIPKLETEVQRLDLEVNVLKDLVRKILRHVYREKRKSSKSQQISGSSMIKENLRAIQTLDSSSSEPFLHTWKNRSNFSRYNSPLP